MKTLLIGKDGQVGRELLPALSALGPVVATGRKELDLADQRALQEIIRRHRPGLIINAAAYTAVDLAEEETEAAMTVNAVAPGVIAREAALCGARLVHYSTDYVFDGSGHNPYTEEDRPSPINFYGKSKLAGEEAVRESEVHHLILRTAWVYSLRRKNFLLTIMRLALHNRKLHVVDDQHGAPTWARTIARATARIISSQAFSTPRWETYHLSAGGQTTWYGFAREIVRHLRKTAAREVSLEPITTDLYPTPAARPPYSVLSSARLTGDFAIELPLWDVALTECLREADPAFLAALAGEDHH